MSAHRIGRWAWVALLPAALVLMTGARAAETSVSFSLDYEIDGRAAPFLLPFDKGYYKAEGVNVTIAPATGSPSSTSMVRSTMRSRRRWLIASISRRKLTAGSA